MRHTSSSLWSGSGVAARVTKKQAFSMTVWTCAGEGFRPGQTCDQGFSYRICRRRFRVHLVRNQTFSESSLEERSCRSALVRKRKGFCTGFATEALSDNLQPESVGNCFRKKGFRGRLLQTGCFRSASQASLRRVYMWSRPAKSL